jgi:mannose-1-phosphate guanylyltransferase/mannose-6-phosphate isomerase
MQITPVLLAGGSGSRLWPLSRKSYPKQFSKIIGTNSLFQQSGLRLLSSKKISFGSHLTVTNNDYRFIVQKQLRDLEITPGPIIIEPSSKNTGPAILAACLYSNEHNLDEIMLVAPSDHVISNNEAFHDALKAGLPYVNDGNIVTLGITPTRPETGYGYLELENAVSGTPEKLKSFVEKPSKEIAQKMLSSGNYLWNAGIFMFRAKDLVTAFEQHSVALLSPVREAVEKGKKDLEFFRLDPNAWSRAESISIDCAVMEKVKNVYSVPFFSGWSDLGGWDAVGEAMGKDRAGNSLSKKSHAFHCEDTILRSENDGPEVVGIGLKSLIAISMQDAVLIVDKSSIDKVKETVETLKVRKVKQAEIFPKDFRPWGWFESLTLSDRFQVKRIFVNPGASLSLQSHHHRSEHWVVVEGTAKVTVNEDVKLLTEGESVYIPLGAVHRMENPGKVPMILIEVQTGSYLEEDDIIRYDDIYARN